jgi:hypothetical protein
MRETSLHRALQDLYTQPGDEQEVPLEGYVVDVVSGDLLIEVQTSNFPAIKRKLLDLVPRYAVRLVHPIAYEKWIVKQSGDGKRTLGRRKSPKRGRYVHLFDELVSFPGLLAEESFSLDVVLTQEDEIRRHDPRRAWRRKGWVIHERRLLSVVDCQRFERPADVTALLPSRMPDPFTTADLARALKQPRRLAQRMAYCLREMNEIVPVGKRGNAIVYSRA